MAVRIIATVTFVGGMIARSLAAEAQESFFRITVIDEQTERGVPLVELTTVNGVRHVTDSAGVIAFSEPGLMEQAVYFRVSSHGYEHKADRFGFRGVRLTPVAGGSATVKVRRINIAERLYRITGGGIYRDSELLGDAVPLAQPLLNGQVFGSDSVQNAVYRGRIHWFWGDTNRPSYPLGNFHVPGAVSTLPAEGGLPPSVGVDLSYYVGKDGFAKATCKMPGEGPTWIGGLTVVHDAAGDERMFAAFVKVKPPMTVYERGLAEWNDERREFESRLTIPLDAPMFPRGHVFIDQAYVYYADPYPDVRVPARAETVLDLKQYEEWSCLVRSAGEEEIRVDRDETGRPRFAWRREGVPATRKTIEKLTAAGTLEKEEVDRRFEDAETGDAVIAHGGSVSWNAYRQKWVMIFVQTFGRSLLGEVWYAEAPEITGPWRKATRVATHDRYSFYNPKQHPMLEEENGRFIYFEGTYTHTFSGNPEKTPRYDYNQVMYRLDLSDTRLHAD